MSNWFVIMAFSSNPHKKLHTAHYAANQSQAVLQARTYWSTRTTEKLVLVSAEKLCKLSEVDN